MLVSGLLLLILQNKRSVAAYIAPIIFYIAGAVFAFLKRDGDSILLYSAIVSAVLAVVLVILCATSRNQEDEDDYDEDEDDEFEDENFEDEDDYDEDDYDEFDDEDDYDEFDDEDWFSRLSVRFLISLQIKQYILAYFERKTLKSNF